VQKKTLASIMAAAWHQQIQMKLISACAIRSIYLQFEADLMVWVERLSERHFMGTEYKITIPEGINSILDFEDFRKFKSFWKKDENMEIILWDKYQILNGQKLWFGLRRELLE
jgi:hypothetical protein